MTISKAKLLCTFVEYIIVIGFSGPLWAASENHNPNDQDFPPLFFSSTSPDSDSPQNAVDSGRREGERRLNPVHATQFLARAPSPLFLTSSMASLSLRNGNISPVFSRHLEQLERLRLSRASSPTIGLRPITSRPNLNSNLNENNGDQSEPSENIRENASRILFSLAFPNIQFNRQQDTPIPQAPRPRTPPGVTHGSHY